MINERIRCKESVMACVPFFVFIPEWYLALDLDKDHSDVSTFFSLLVSLLPPADGQSQTDLLLQLESSPAKETDRGRSFHVTCEKLCLDLIRIVESKTSRCLSAVEESAAWRLLSLLLVLSSQAKETALRGMH